MNDIAIKVENLGKMYRIGAEEQRPDGLWDATKQAVLSPFDYLRRITRPPTEEETLWALKDVSFEVKRGEVVGIIGRNGAGKSTLLKVLSRITEPTEGRAVINGRVGSLLEVGTGFHPELTGRENIYLNGAILGMTKDEIDRKFDEIVDFSGVEKFIDTPVKRYSSGMRVRLAFSVAAHLDPEILLIDEVLAVGDAAFQKKCLGKMGDVARSGRTVLFVSHNMASIAHLCTRTILLDNGQIARRGAVNDCIRFYLDQFNSKEEDKLDVREDRRGSGEIRLTRIFFENNGKPSETVQTGKPCTICFEYEAERNVNNVAIAYTIRDQRAQFLFRPSSQDTGQVFDNLSKKGMFRCVIDRLPLTPGRYRITTRITVNGMEADYVEGAAFLVVSEGDFFGTGRLNDHSPVLLDHSWEVESYE
jgi:lipopolysaccharide transport system ATP-binding protein